MTPPGFPDPSGFLQYGALGIVALVIVSGIYFLRLIIDAHTRTLDRVASNQEQSNKAVMDKLEVVHGVANDTRHAVDSSRQIVVSEIGKAAHDLAATISEAERIRELAELAERRAGYRGRQDTPKVVA